MKGVSNYPSNKQMSAQETATPRSHVETAHSGRRAHASLLKRIQFGRLQRRYDGSCGRRWCGLKTGAQAARVRPLIGNFRSSSVLIYATKNEWISEDTQTFIEAASWMLHLMIEWILVCSSSTVSVLVLSCQLERLQRAIWILLRPVSSHLLSTIIISQHN